MLGVRHSRTILRYVVLGLLGNSLVTFLSVGAVLGIYGTLKATQDVALPLLIVLPVLLMSMGKELVYAIPLSLLLGTGLMIGRLIADRELLALRSVGVSPLQLMVPVLALGVGASAIAFHVNHSWVPKFRSSATNIEALILDNVQNLGEGWNVEFALGNQSIWIYHHDGPLLEGIFVGVSGEDKGEDALVSPSRLQEIDAVSYPFYLFAQTGRIFQSGEGVERRVVVELRGVSVFMDDRTFDQKSSSDYQHRVWIETLQWSPPLSHEKSGLKNLTASELWQEIESRHKALLSGRYEAGSEAFLAAKGRYDRAIAVRHRRLAMSLCPLTFPLTAFALGLCIRSTNRLMPFFLSSTIVPAVYFTLALVGDVLAGSHGVAPWAVQQMGNVALLCLSGLFVSWAQGTPRG